MAWPKRERRGAEPDPDNVIEGIVAYADNQEYDFLLTSLECLEGLKVSTSNAKAGVPLEKISIPK